jgi:hypothetical protein
LKFLVQLRCSVLIDITAIMSTKLVESMHFDVAIAADGKDLYPLPFVWKVMPHITINGTIYLLGHLDSRLIWHVPMRDFADVEFKKPVFVTYSCHCYSKGEKAGVPFNVPSQEIIWDGIRRREFCCERYNLSLILPHVVEKLLFSPHAYVWDTGKGNRHYHELVATPNIDSQCPYYLFMRIEKDKIEDGPHVIKMVVESAYPIHPPDPAPREDSALSMAVWLGKTWSPAPLSAIKNKNKRKKK